MIVLGVLVVVLVLILVLMSGVVLLSGGLQGLRLFFGGLWQFVRVRCGL